VLLGKGRVSPLVAALSRFARSRSGSASRSISPPAPSPSNVLLLALLEPYQSSKDCPLGDLSVFNSLAALGFVVIACVRKVA
jgi:mevalonate pyrophosphate decarboxylase